MKQRYAVPILFVLIVASGFTSFHSYQSMERLVTDDMNQAWNLTRAEQRTDIIMADTIRVFNSHLQMEQLRGQVALTVDTRHQGFRPRPQCSAATIFSLSEQRPAMVLWMTALMWGLFCLYQQRWKNGLLGVTASYGGLSFSAAEGRFFNARGEAVRLTPMQQQLMEMFFRSSSHLLTKTEICNALWPKKDDASETLYTLIRRLKPIVEHHSDLRIVSDRGRAYELTVK